MDSLTQIVLGAAVGELILGKKIGIKAALWGAIGGTIPDLDVVGKYFLSDIDALLFHRGFMHSIFFVFFIGPFISFIPYRIYQYKYNNLSYFDWWLLIFLSLITHPILDAFTTWGTQLFWPLNHRVAIKSIFVVDPIYTLPFLFFLLISLCLHQNSNYRRFINITGILISSTFLFSTTIRQYKAKEEVIEYLKIKKINYEEVSLRALPLNVFWNISVKTKNGFLNAIYSPLYTKDSISFNYYPQNKHILPSEILDFEDFKKIQMITNDYFIVEKLNNSFVISDLRFGKTSFKQSNKNLFMFQYKIFKGEKGELVTSFVQNRPIPQEFLAEFINLFY
jgi:inner membrane protein